MNKRISLFIILGIILTLILTSCGGASYQEAKKVQDQQSIYANNQPVPSFTWSLTRAELIQIYVAKNSAVATYSLVYNQYKGIIQFQCPSYGYPIPGGTELTAPEAPYVNSSGGISDFVIPQAEPDGTFSPSNSAGTYIICRNDDGSAYPVYVEDNVLTFPFLMKTDSNGQLVKATESDVSSVEINVKPPENLAP
jgi:hypothetical protein